MQNHKFVTQKLVVIVNGFNLKYTYWFTHNLYLFLCTNPFRWNRRVKKYIKRKEKGIQIDMLKTWETNREFFKFSARPYDGLFSPFICTISMLLLSSSTFPLFTGHFIVLFSRLIFICFSFCFYIKLFFLLLLLFLHNHIVFLFLILICCRQ